MGRCLEPIKYETNIFLTAKSNLPFFLRDDMLTFETIFCKALDSS